MEDSKLNLKSGKTESDKGFYWVLSVAMVFTLFASLVGYSIVVKNYEHKSHEANGYVDSDQYGTLLLRVDSLCSVGEVKSEQREKDCKQTREQIEALAGVADLRAQQTMAHATRGILFAAWFQYMVSVAALALVAVTLYATWRMLGQAANTAFSAHKTLEQATRAADAADKTLAQAAETTEAANKAANAAERAERPFLFSRLDAVLRGEESDIHDSHTADSTIRVSLENHGKTPAGKVRALLQCGRIDGFMPNNDSPFSDPFVGNVHYSYALPIQTKLCIDEVDFEYILGIRLFRALQPTHIHPTRWDQCSMVFVLSLQYQDLVRRKPVSDCQIHICRINMRGADDRTFQITPVFGVEDFVAKNWGNAERERFFAEPNYTVEDANMQ